MTARGSMDGTIKPGAYKMAKNNLVHGGRGKKVGHNPGSKGSLFGSKGRRPGGPAGQKQAGTSHPSKIAGGTMKGPKGMSRTGPMRVSV